MKEERLDLGAGAGVEGAGVYPAAACGPINVPPLVVGFNVEGKNALVRALAVVTFELVLVGERDVPFKAGVPEEPIEKALPRVELAKEGMGFILSAVLPV